MKKHLQAYEEFKKKKIGFDSFDYKFYDGFIDYLTFDYVQRRRKTINMKKSRYSNNATISQQEFTLKSMPQQQRCNKLKQENKMMMNIIKMICYRA